MRVPTSIFNICITMLGMVPLSNEKTRTAQPVNISVDNPTPKPKR